MAENEIARWLVKTQEHEANLLDRARIDRSQKPSLAWEGRTFIPVNQNQPIPPSAQSKVRIMAYNVSADCKFSGINVDYTTANDSMQRWATIIREIMAIDPDVIAIQDMDLFKQFWQPKLMVLGYDTCFKKRTEVRAYQHPPIIFSFISLYKLLYFC